MRAATRHKTSHSAETREKFALRNDSVAAEIGQFRNTVTCITENLKGKPR
jgi:hypothetical protein